MDLANYQKFFDNSVRHTKEVVDKKLVDSNTSKCTQLQPHHRLVIIPNIAKLIFSYIFIKMMKTSEKVDSGTSMKYAVRSLERVVEVFGVEVLVKLAKGSSVLIINPWIKIKNDVCVFFNDKKRHFLQKGLLCIPIRDLGKSMLCFFPSIGLNSDDEIPMWVSEFKLSDLGLNLPTTSLLKIEGQGKVNLCAGDDEVTIPNVDGQDIKEGHFIMVRQEMYQVLGICPAFNYPGKFYVRFTENIRKNAKNAQYDIYKSPVIKGNMVSLPKSILEDYRPVQVSLEKIDQNDFGTMNVRYQNSCFNVLGFLTHDNAV